MYELKRKKQPAAKGINIRKEDLRQIWELGLLWVVGCAALFLLL